MLNKKTIGYQVITYSRLGCLMPEDGKHQPLSYAESVTQRDELRKSIKDKDHYLYRIEAVEE